MPVTASNAREVAFAALMRGGLATRGLEEVARDFRLSPADRAFAHELVAGVERRRGTLDALIAAFVPSKGIQRDLRAALRLGLYQILFLDRVPPHAAVNETVALVAERRGNRFGGFVNAVLRGVLRELVTEVAREPGGSDRRTLVAGARVHRFARDVFPDPASDAIGHLAAVHSHPRFVVGRWVDRFGAATAIALLEAGNRSPEVTVRTNRLRTTREALASELRAAGFDVAEGEHPLALRLGVDPRGLYDSEPFRRGLFTAQDETAMRVADLLAPKPGERVLDLCAAPGGKATQIAEAIGDDGEIVAADVSGERLERVRENAARLGLRSIRPCVVERGRAPGGRFDRALVDAPCSNSGVFARRPEARWRLTPASLRSIGAAQAACLRVGLAALRPGGRLVYATCSIEREENEEIVRRAVASRRGASVGESWSALPSRAGDGGYAAAIDADAAL